ncbi:hypothetical protein KW797_00790 [Candidatus Parcubacteria bacterium]|nr:hypothetical protein [Candidatus Parcubacteria bacterium]
MEERDGKRVFRHGTRRFNRIPAEALGRIRAKVLVVRDESLFDRGRVEFRGGHDGSSYFAGLERVVPAINRFYASPPHYAGLVGNLDPQFKASDVIRLRVPSSKFGSLLSLLGVPEL